MTQAPLFLHFAIFLVPHSSCPGFGGAGVQADGNAMTAVSLTWMTQGTPAPTCPDAEASLSTADNYHFAEIISHYGWQDGRRRGGQVFSWRRKPRLARAPSRRYCRTPSAPGPSWSVLGEPARPEAHRRTRSRRSGTTPREGRPTGSVRWGRVSAGKPRPGHSSPLPPPPTDPSGRWFGCTGSPSPWMAFQGTNGCGNDLALPSPACPGKPSGSLHSSCLGCQPGASLRWSRTPQILLPSWLGVPRPGAENCLPLSVSMSTQRRYKNYKQNTKLTTLIID